MKRARQRPKPRSPRAPSARPASSTALSRTARLRRSRSRQRRPWAALDPDFCPTDLNADQRAAADDLIRLVADRAFSTTLLEGVTGSGKTEVYFEAVAEALRQKRQALVLLPEIALTGQFLDRFAARFGARPAEWHSGLTARQRERIWNGGRKRRGARRLSARARRFSCRSPSSASSSSMKNMRAPTSRRRASSTTRATWRWCARASRRRRSCWPRRRRRSRPASTPQADATAGSSLPRASARPRCPTSPWSTSSAKVRRAADGCRRAPSPGSRRRGPGASRRCCSSTAAATRRSRSADRAAIASNVPIARPGWSSTDFAHPSSAIIAAMSRAGRKLCPQCHEADTLTACGPGVERLAEEAEALFPDIRTLVLSSDTPGGIETLRGQLDAAARGAYDLIIGTQLVAKGHNFPLLTFVCIVDADVGLANADPRAAERTFQLLRQATGRAGRGDKPGRALLQTWQPEHPVIAALMSGDAERFYAQETEQRRLGGLPPFGRLAAIIISAEDRGAAEAHARALARRRPSPARSQDLARRAARRPAPERTRSSCSGRRRRRSRSCASAIAFASPPRRRGLRTYRDSCAPCWPQRPSRAAGFVLRSTSIRRAFSSGQNPPPQASDVAAGSSETS